jgi:hypothetical protein
MPEKNNPSKLQDKYAKAIGRSNPKLSKSARYAIAKATLNKQGLAKKGSNKLTRKGAGKS